MHSAMLHMLLYEKDLGWPILNSFKFLQFALFFFFFFFFFFYLF